MIVAGLGCRRGTSASDILAVIAEALTRHGLTVTDLAGLATEAAKVSDPGLEEAACTLRLPLIGCALTDLQSVDQHALTRSERVAALKGVPSIAETAALFAAGRHARLLGPRIARARATCALAVSETVERRVSP